MMYNWSENTNIGFAVSAVKEVECSEGTKYFLEDPSNPQDWRWLTDDEKAEYLASKDTHDAARAADDGFGAAIGANVDVEADDNDLGARWGESSAVPQTMTEAFERSSGPGEVKFDGGVGASVLTQIGELNAIAQKMLEEAAADPINKRFALLVFNMKDVDPETTAGEVESFQRISTSDDEMIVDYAKQMVLEKLLSRVRGDGIGTPANSLEI